MNNRAYAVIALLAFLPGANAQGPGDPEQIRTELEACVEGDGARRDACTYAVLQRIPQQREEDVARQAAFQQYQGEIAAALARSGEPRKLALAALVETLSGLDGSEGDRCTRATPPLRLAHATVDRSFSRVAQRWHD